MNTIDMYVLGTVYPEPETDENGDAIPGQEPIAGYHVNTTEAVVYFKQFEIKPKTPMSAIGGVKTFYYRFANEAQFNEFLAFVGNYNLIEISI